MKFTIWLPAFLLVFLAAAAMAGEKATSAHAFSFTAIDDSGQLALSAYRGKVVLVVNTASFCGFTQQYSGLEKLWRTYKEKGFVLLGVPSNDFGGQEPKSNLEVKKFCQGAFNVTFPLAKKTKVRRAGAHEFYRWVDHTTSGAASPRWNFHKILIGKDGRLVDWFASSVDPSSAKVRTAIEAALGSSDTSS